MTAGWRPRWTGGALAPVAGSAWALAAPPRGWWPLLPLGAATLALALAGRAWRERLLLGGVAGAVLYGTTLPWLTDFSPPGYVVMALVEALLLAGTATLAARWWTLPAALVALEAVQIRFPLGGFPLPGLVYSRTARSCSQLRSAVSCSSPGWPPLPESRSSPRYSHRDAAGSLRAPPPSSPPSRCSPAPRSAQPLPAPSTPPWCRAAGHAGPARSSPIPTT